MTHSETLLTSWLEVLESAQLLFVAVIVPMLPIELVLLHRRGQLTKPRIAEMLASGVQVIPQSLAAIGIAALQLAVLTALASLVPWRVPVSGWSVALAVLGADFLYYWEHRASHRVNLLWSLFHSVHHSSPVYDQSTALRLSVFDGLQSCLFHAPLVLVGFPPSLALAAVLVVVAYQTWIHTELVGQLPRPLEWLLNTPSHHRVHHGSNSEYIDKNYGGLLIVWDRLFGTFAREAAPVRYGLTTPIGTTHWLDVQVHELRRMWRSWLAARGWRAKWGVLAHPPN